MKRLMNHSNEHIPRDCDQKPRYVKDDSKNRARASNGMLQIWNFRAGCLEEEKKIFAGKQFLKVVVIFWVFSSIPRPEYNAGTIDSYE